MNSSFLIFFISIALLVVNIQNQCPTGQFQPSGGGACQACDVTCYECDSTGPTDCTTCVATRTKTGSNACQCIDGFQQQGTVSADCVAITCHHSCLTCNNTATQCSTCDSSSLRTKVSNTCPCNDKYFDNSVALCESCHYSCATCSGGSTSSDCLTCNSLSKRATMSGGICNCLSAFYDDGANELCQPCIYYCASCQTSSTNCVTCGANRGAAPSCPCSNYFYDDGSSLACQSCEYSCLTCSTQSSCATCDSTKFRALSGLSPYCVCIDRYFNSGTTQLCSSCNPTCLTCNTISTNCTSCNSANYRNLTGSSCVCQNGYFQTSPTIELCSACNYRCRTCQILSTNCTTCSGTAFRTTDGNGNCPCNTGYYEGTNGLCTLCHSSCLTCTTGSACTGCVVATLKTINATTGLCECADTMYFNTTNNICQACNYKCLTCNQSSPTVCLSCDTGRTFSSFSCPCLPFYFDDGSSSACQLCHHSCLSCNAASSSSCLTCSASNQRTFSSGQCLCNSKFYDDLSHALCQPCIYNCLTCTNSSQCATCDNTANRVMSGTTCVCKPKFYEASNKSCTACHYSCMTCSTGSTCDTCDNTKFRQINSTSSLCSCMNNYFDSGTLNEICELCQYSCLTCSTQSSCATCDSTKFRALSGLSPYCVCIDRYFNSGTTQLCSSCNPTCLTCNTISTNCTSCNSANYRNLTGSSCVCQNGYFQTSPTIELCSACNYRCRTCQILSTNCTTCSGTAFRTTDGNGNCPCNTGYYEGSNGLCTLCHSSCLTCTTGSACTGCVVATLKTINATTGLCECADTMYFNTTNNICQACNYKCLTCNQSSPTVCLSCDASRSISSFSCPCLPFYFDDGSSIACLPCHHSCATCNAASSSSCLTCSASNKRTISSGQCLCNIKFYDDLSHALCQPCIYNCLTCTNSSQCVTCDNTANRVMSGTTCVCKAKFYEASNKSCTACHYSCMTCSTGTTCDTCDNTKFRQINTTSSLCSCMNNYFNNGVDQTCYICFPQCLTCTNVGTCSSCNSTLFRYLTALNRCACSSGYWDNSGTCTPCMYNCLTCSSSTTCASCNSTAQRQLNSGTNNCDCKPGYFDNGTSTSQCSVCSYACKQCVTTATTCTVCDTSVRSLSGSQWCDCHQHYYDNNSTMVCPICQYSCQTCTNSTQCATCSAAKFRIFDSSTKYCDCQIKYYSDLSTELCHACNYACKTCTNSTKCLTCDSAKFRQTPNSMCPCVEGYYDDALGNQLCIICDHSCKSCTNGTQCAVCDSATALRTYSSSTKLCSCLTKYYDDGTNQVCKACVYSCATCLTSSGNCLTCNTSSHRSKVGSSCPCREKFYDGNLAQLCLACQYTCATCTDGISCDTCNSAKFRQDNGTTNLCSCMTGYYDDTVNEVCPQCNLTCMTCINGITCSSCDSARMRTLNSTADYAGNTDVKCPCIYKYYSPAPDQNCLACHYSCAVCSGGSVNNCLYCTSDAHRRLAVASSLCKCRNGFYDDGSNELCETCNVACSICTGPATTQCTSCNGSTYLLISATTCYVTCPAYYFNDDPSKVCTSCPLNCNTCINSTKCTDCDSPYYLYDQQCLAVCPGGTYPNATSRTCINCPIGCSLCSSNVVCSACKPRYYFDSVIDLCFSCNDNCKECLGPGQGQCTSCYQPLYFRNNKCFNLTCPFSQYVDSSLGCLNCSDLYPNSLTCNKTQAFLCVQLYKIVNKQCVYCSQVSGYHVTKIGTCSQICGDGVVYEYQCDDGNNMRGDGCSSNCMIQSGWSCDSTFQPTICTLQQTLAMTLVKAKKLSGQNRVNLQLSLNIEYRLTSGFALSILGVDSSLYEWKFSQGTNLSQIFLQIKYKTPLDNKQVQISYAQTRRLLQQDGQSMQTNARMLIAVSFTSNFNINSYPPANYYPQQRIFFYQKTTQIIQILALVLVIMCLILIPTKMHLHSLTFITILPQIYLVFGVTITSQTDWINYLLRRLSLFSLVQGVSLGQCCYQMSSYLNYDTQIINNQGLALLIWISFWIIYGILALYDKICTPIRHKLQNISYFILTIHLIFFYNFTYSSFNSLYHYSIQNQADAFNTTLGIALIILTAVILALTWGLSWQIELPKQDQNELTNESKLYTQAIFNDNKFNKEGLFIQSDTQNKIESRIVQSRDHIIDLEDSEQNNVKLSTGKTINPHNQNQQNQKRESSSLTSIHQRKFSSNSIDQESNFPIQVGKILSVPQKFLNYDYLSLYKYSENSKFFLPAMYTKLYVCSLITVFAQSQPFYCISILGCIEAVYLIYLISARPFASTFTNFRLVITSLLFVSMHGVVAYYLYLALSNTYIQLFEYIFIILCGATLLLAVIFSFIEHVKAWKKQLYELIYPCLVYFRLSTRQGHRVFDAKNLTKKKRQNIIAQEIINQKTIKKEQDEKQQELDAFYSRMLKKDKVNKKYRRQRMMKQSVYHPY